MRFDRQRHGLVIRADDEPIAGDHNQNDPRLQAYFEIARALSPLYPQDVPDFAGQLFGNSGDSTAWVRRFIEPANW